MSKFLTMVCNGILSANFFFAIYSFISFDELRKFYNDVRTYTYKYLKFNGCRRNVFALLSLDFGISHVKTSKCISRSPIFKLKQNANLFENAFISLSLSLSLFTCRNLSQHTYTHSHTLLNDNIISFQNVV